MKKWVLDQFEDLASKQCKQCKQVKKFSEFPRIEEEGVHRSICKECLNEPVQDTPAINNDFKILGETMDETNKEKISVVETPLIEFPKKAFRNAETIFETQLKPYILKKGAGFTVPELKEHLWQNWKTSQIYAMMEEIVAEQLMQKVKAGKQNRFYLDSAGFKILSLYEVPEEQVQKDEVKITVDTSKFKEAIEKTEQTLKDMEVPQEVEIAASLEENKIGDPVGYEPPTTYGEVNVKPLKKMGVVHECGKGAAAKLWQHERVDKSIRTVLKDANQIDSRTNCNMIKLVATMKDRVQSIKIQDDELELELKDEQDIIPILDLMDAGTKKVVQIIIKDKEPPKQGLLHKYVEGNLRVIGIPTIKPEHKIILKVLVYNI